MLAKWRLIEMMVVVRCTSGGQGSKWELTQCDAAKAPAQM
jgi:hypothetical protein